MTMSDPLGDMLTRIRNGQRAQKQAIVAPASRLRVNVLEVLQREGFIRGYSESQQREGVAELRIELKYGPNGERVIRHIKRVSKPGRRVYRRADGLRPVLNGLGISIISTSRGVISDREARQRNLGGEVLCELW